MDNFQVAQALREIADLLEIQGANLYKINAYRRAARQLEHSGEPLGELHKEGRLASIPGLGKSIAWEVGTLLDTGSSPLLRELQDKTPPPILALARLPGVGIKTARLIYRQGGITNDKELRKALKNRSLRRLVGVGVEVEEIIRQGLLTAGAKPNQNISLPLLISTARTAGGELKEAIISLPEIEDCQLVGEARRGEQFVKELVLLASATDLKRAYNSIKVLPRLQVGETGTGEGYLDLRVKTGAIMARVRLVTPPLYYVQLLWETGPSAHWFFLAEKARGCGWHLCGTGFFDHKKRLISSRREEEIYHRLDLPYVVPEARHRTDEAIAWLKAGQVPLTTADIRGDLHIHTRWSDGGGTIEEMQKAAGARGYEYMAITDHSPSLKLAGGLSLSHLQQQMEHIDRINERGLPPYILKGMEVDIDLDGSLDLPDAYLERLDWVVASVHSGFRIPTAAMTNRIIKAVHHPRVMVLGHPTGRLYPLRPAYIVDMVALFKAASQAGVAMEINCSPDRLDLNEAEAIKAEHENIRLVLGSDAHHSRHLEYMEYGVMLARRAGLNPANILNTLPLEAMLAWGDRKRR